MTYEAVLAAIHSRKTFSSAASLERIARLMERLGNPQDRVKCIHVAGTNGKGSVCALVEAVLRTSGFQTGLFTSPYLVDFRERIQINRVPISKEALDACYETVMAEESALEQAGSEPVNEFELVTAIGFTAFAEAQADYAVIEVGLGGRFDATNVIRAPAVCCITPISLDHTAVLGNTVAEIAAEKAGIIKPGCPVVVARQLPEAEAVLRETAAQVGSPMTETGAWTSVSSGVSGQFIDYVNRKLYLPLLGRCQGDNVAAAWEVCSILGLSGEMIQRGFAGVSWPGRLHYVNSNPPVLIDAGHNPAGIAALCDTLDELFSQREILAVMAMMRDKDYARCIPQIAKRSRLLIATTVNLPRSLPPGELAAAASPWCETLLATSISEGLAAARAAAGPNSLILVCGSVYAAGEALTANHISPQ